MFSSGIFIVEHDLHSKTLTKKAVNKINPETCSSTPKNDKTKTPASSTSSGANESQVTSTTNGNKANIATEFSPIPKSDPIAQPPNSDSVDAGQGPKPEPVTRSPGIPLSFKLIWAIMMAPGNPSI
jgi:hypothetical protein